MYNDYQYLTEFIDLGDLDGNAMLEDYIRDIMCEYEEKLVNIRPKKRFYTNFEYPEILSALVISKRMMNYWKYLEISFEFENLLPIKNKINGYILLKIFYEIGLPNNKYIIKYLIKKGININFAMTLYYQLKSMLLEYFIDDIIWKIDFSKFELGYTVNEYFDLMIIINAKTKAHKILKNILLKLPLPKEIIYYIINYTIKQW